MKNKTKVVKLANTGKMSAPKPKINNPHFSYGVIEGTSTVFMKFTDTGIDMTNPVHAQIVRDVTATTGKFLVETAKKHKEAKKS